jgi:peptidoglycan hydrolase-like protein with peptidoglycan-binding domain
MPDEKEIAAGVAKDATAQPAAAPATAVAQAKPTATVPPGFDPKVQALQKQLIAKGAKITADGKMGPATQTAMKQFPGVAVAEHNKGTTMSEAQRIAELRDRLAQLESNQQVDEISFSGIGNAIKSGASSVGNFFKGAKAGVQGGAAASNVASGAANLGKAGEKGLAAAQAVKGAGGAVKAAATGNTAKNIAKVGGGAAIGAAGMAALGGGAATKPADPAKPTAPKVPGAPAAPTAPDAPATQTPNAEADPADVAELNKLAGELENSTDPADIALLQRYNGVINAINNRQAGDKRTQAEIAASAGLGDAK